MQLDSVEVRGYRCLQEVSVTIGSYTALVGANGAGKSTVLYALNWLFNGGELTAEDLCKATGRSDATSITVKVTFRSLTELDREVLKSYAIGDGATFRRSWSSEEGEKIVGNAVQGPGFASVRKADSAKEMKEKYAEVRSRVLGLPAETVKSKIVSALEHWEQDSTNSGLLEEVPDAEANHFFGFNGEHTLSRLVRLVLVPAASNLASELGENSRGSALNAIVGALMTTAVKSARDDWERINKVQLNDLAASIKDGVDAATSVHAKRISGHLNELVPGAGLSFSAEAPAWSVKGEPQIRTSICIEGANNDVTRQGHGVQRAVMIAMLQALTAPTDAGINPDAENLDNDELSAGRPNLIICVEEPEIYQHPVRARNFARVLSRLAETGAAQVLIATHSPYFVRPEQFDCLRRMTLREGRAAVTSMTMGQVAIKSQVSEPNMRKAAVKEFPRALSEGFFSDAVILVEGDTDKIIIESAAELLNRPLDASGVTVIALGGKTSLRAPHALLSGLGVRIFVLCDGDYGTAEKKYGSSEEKRDKREAAHASHAQATATLLSWLPGPVQPPTLGSWPYIFGSESMVSETCGIWKDDLEAELNTWGSFVTAMESAGSPMDGKDALAYRAGVIAADSLDMPPSLRELVGAAHSLLA